jgi:pyruvate ferredoxin oxidoreductase gamma subunit
MHGRGGQGIKTASQILGTSGFLSGMQAQDFPLYGAERRGAPITAYARLNADPILERGPIARPDLILIGDETLVDDPIAHTTAGCGPETVLFINSIHTPSALAEHYRLPVIPVVADLTGLCLCHIGRRTALSAAISAASARLIGRIGLDMLLIAVESELEEIGIRDALLKKNIDLARAVYEILQPVPQLLTDASTQPELVATRIIELRQESVTAAAPLILAAANMGLKKTGNWRVTHPEIDRTRCNRCGICFARCPEGGIRIEPDGLPSIDYDHCKGCLICAQECPLHVISTLREEAVWA